MQPLFLLSLPRSASTLLQRILAAHPEIDTVSEPWLLLPLVYMRRRFGIAADAYDHDIMAMAIDDFARQLPNGDATLRDEIRLFATRLYQLASSGDATYFLDKTPPYALIADELMETFPESKFILLWRHPLAAAASWIDTFGRGRWNLHRFRAEVDEALPNLVRAAQEHPGRLCVVRYEEIIESPEAACRRVFDYLELDFHPDVLHAFSNVTLEGRMGDPTGVGRYQRLSDMPLERWHQTMDNPVRKAWSRHYLRAIGRDQLGTMGYDYDDLMREVDELQVTGHRVVSDLLGVAYGRVFWMLKAWFMLRGYRNSLARAAVRRLTRFPVDGR